MEDLLKQLSSFLGRRKPVEIETLTLEDDDSPVGSESYESDETPDLKDDQDLTLNSSKTIGGPTEFKNPIYLNPKEVVDNRNPEVQDDTVMVWNKAKNCYVKRKRT